MGELMMPFSALVLVCFVNLALSSRYAMIEEEKHISPQVMVFCDHGSQIQTDSIACLDSCDFRLREVKQLCFHQQTHDESVTIGVCRKQKKSYLFTETWTFSKISEGPIVESLEPNAAECHKAWKDACEKKPCVMLSKNVEPEYHWASDTKVEITEVLVDASTRLMPLSFSDLHLNILGEEVPIDSGAAIIRGEMMIWDPVEMSKSVCKLSEALGAHCYRINKIQGWYCPEIGIKVNSSKYLSNSHRCTKETDRELWLGDNGELFTVGKCIIAKENHPGFPIYVGEQEEIKAVVNSVTEALHQRDIQICIRSCLKKPDIGNLQMFGTNLVLNEEDGMKICHLNNECSLKLPVVRCMNSSLFRVTCGSTTRWWNISSIHSPLIYHCQGSKNEINKELSIPSAIGKILINGSGMFHDTESSPEELMIGNKILSNNILSPKHDILSLEHQNNLMIGIGDLLNHSKNISTPGMLSWMKDKISDIKNFVSNLSHEVKASIIWIIIVSIILMILIKARLTFWNNINKKQTHGNKGKIGTPSRQSISDNEKSSKHEADPFVLRVELESE
ncbi:G protein [Rose virus R]|uniref:G protein n=1 Tax=Rose virus R TaxID=2805917 RepID=A0AAE7P864_9RHAB|nr:G protein [Rose virus R]QQZ02077.1 G protein [Rose virus R]